MLPLGRRELGELYKQFINHFLLVISRGSGLLVCGFKQVDSSLRMCVRRMVVRTGRRSTGNGHTELYLRMTEDDEVVFYITFVDGKYKKFPLVSWKLIVINLY